MTTFPSLRKRGIKAIFRPGARIKDIADFVRRKNVKHRRRHLTMTDRKIFELEERKDRGKNLAVRRSHLGLGPSRREIACCSREWTKRRHTGDC